MSLEHVSANFDVSGYNTALINSDSGYTPLGYVTSGGDSTLMPSGGTNPSVFVPVIQNQQQDDGYHFGDFTKAVLKGAGQLIGGALYCGGSALANAGIAYNLAGPRFSIWGPPGFFGPGCFGGGLFGRPCNVTYNYNGPLAPAPGPILNFRGGRCH